MEKETSTAPNKGNYRIMVNFETRKIVHTRAMVGSKEYSKLLDMGYVNTGVIKCDSKGNIKFFWDIEYFNPKAKYLNSPTDTTNA